MNFPESLYYSNEHTWVAYDGKTGVIGITEFAQSELGEIVFVDLPQRGQKYKMDQVFGSVEAIKTVSDLFMPVSGEILEINEDLLKEPTLVNTDPFSKGWMIRIKMEQEDELKQLLSASQYNEMIGK